MVYRSVSFSSGVVTTRSPHIAAISSKFPKSETALPLSVKDHSECLLHLYNTQQVRQDRMHGRIAFSTRFNFRISGWRA
jgi:hypothetical protein